MAVADWKVALEDLGLSAPSAVDAPEGRKGAWYNVRSSFERLGFARLLVSEAGDDLDWHVEAAHPALSQTAVEATRAALERTDRGDWSTESITEHHFVLAGSAPEANARRSVIPLLLLADAVTADRDDLGDLVERLEALTAPDDGTETGAEEQDDSETTLVAAESDDAADVEVPEDGEETEHGEEQQDSPFETIGDEELADEPMFEIAVVDDSVELGMGLPEQLDVDTFDAALKAWSRSLRGRYDVKTSVIAPDGAKELSLAGATTRLMLRVEPDALTGSATVADIAPQLHDHIDTLQKVSAGGIDPLVFLGVRSRSAGPTAPKKSGGSPFESIGEEDSDGDAADEDDSDSPAVLLVDDAPEDVDTGGLILDLSAPLEDGAPLEPGRFDDPRLNGPDATTPLVDVVLRHPGYSDRSIGQVLSILLSIDYADALDLANSAPRVIAWGVGARRAATMKTVVEGAGGRVRLVEPDTFAPQ